jgi:hypothetical protein
MWPLNVSHLFHLVLTQKNQISIHILKKKLEVLELLTENMSIFNWPSLFIDSYL